MSRVKVVSYKLPPGMEEYPESSGWYIVTASDGCEYEWHTYFVSVQGPPQVGDSFIPHVDPHDGSAVVNWGSVQRDDSKTKMSG